MESPRLDGSVVDQLPAVVWTTDLDLRILSLGGRALRPRTAARIGATVRTLAVDGAGTAEIVAAGHEAALAGGTGRYETAYEGGSFEVQVEPRRDGEGRIVGTIGIAVDVTARRTAEEALARRAARQEAAARLGVAALAESDALAAAQLAADVAANTLGAQLSGVGLLEPDGEHLRIVAGHGWRPGLVGDLVVPAFWEQPSESVLRDGAPVTIEDLPASPSRLPSFIAEHGARGALLVALPGAPAPVGLLFVASTEPRRFSEDEATFLRSAANVVASALTRQAHERRFRAVFDGALDAELLADDERRYVDVNEAACRLFGRPREELIGRRVEDVLGGGDAVRAAWAAFLAEGEQHGEVAVVRPDGTTRIADFAAKANVLPGLHLSVLRDVTDARRMAEELRRAQRLETVGQLAGGVAHDFNNLLTAIAGYAELLQGRLAAEDPNARAVREIAKAAERGAALTAQLLAFGRRQVLQPVLLDLNAVVTDTEPILSRLVGEHIAIELVLDPALAAVRADPVQLGQVLLNLAVNARDAMPEGGRLAIETANVDVTRPAAPGLAPGRHVVLRVADEGHGMDAETLARAFEPFFTTKELGRGTGLGLSTVIGVVEQSGGRMTAESAPGAGATFTIYLPPADGALAAGGAREADPPAPGRPPLETVLVVEDEPVVRALVREILEEEGYAVLEADRPSAAFALAERRDRLDLLVTDVVMPEASGRRVAERLTERWPDLPVVYMSGYSDEAVLRHGVLDARSPFLQKPFSPGELLRAVRGALDTAAAA